MLRGIVGKDTMSNMKSLISGVFVVITCFWVIPSSASHVTAGEVVYECLGNGEFAVTLNVYRDCAGISLSLTQTIEVEDDCGNAFSFEPQFISSMEISQLCPADLPNSACNGGNLPGIEVYVFRDTVTIPPCQFTTFSFTQCCRNAAILNLDDPGSHDFYVETTFNSQDFPCDNSPVFNNLPAPYVCANTPVNYGFAASEADGDSLVYTFVQALELGAAPILYTPGYTFDEPIPGITLDPNTGLLQFTSAINGNFVVTVLVSQYRPDGTFVGSVMRDLQFVVIACNNTPPDPTTGVVQNLVGADQISDYRIDVCNSNQFCFDFSISDPDVGDILSITSNVESVLPGSTINWTGGNPATGTICWNAVSGVAGFNSFIIQAQDDACPVSAFNSYVYTVTICPQPMVEFPNVFTPNGDGSNDAFYFLEMQGFEDFTVKIYNRWGQVKHEISTLRSDLQIWRPSGDVTEGTYYYIFEGTTAKGGEVITKTGHITLIR
jgi:gliding motility-associated-like protein